ncbi:type III secretion protein [Pseudaminobacter sp. 19-2017]|uniref:Type III secretion protein n=1 Tax=Pseudaminobacter soli (ex Zhang et al. 2022) TaxID=2831468 RepID=A0A942I1Q6_9HYPH|nr:type III secretion protein [Pseudaminobacter soli]
MCIWIVSGALALICAVIAPANAIEPTWPDGPYKYIAVDQAVDAALMEFGRNLGISIKLGKGIKGRLNSGEPHASAREFLDWVCDRYGLVWHYDGSTLNIVTEADLRTEIVRVDRETISDLAERLDRIGVSDSRFPLKISEEDRAVTISGPPSYTALVKQSVGLDDSGTASKEVNVRVFRGRTVDVQPVTSAAPSVATQ